MSSLVKKFYIESRSESYDSGRQGSVFDPPSAVQTKSYRVLKSLYPSVHTIMISVRMESGKTFERGLKTHLTKTEKVIQDVKKIVAEKGGVLRRRGLVMSQSVGSFSTLKTRLDDEFEIHFPIPPGLFSSDEDSQKNIDSYELKIARVKDKLSGIRYLVIEGERYLLPFEESEDNKDSKFPPQIPEKEYKELLDDCVKKAKVLTMTAEKEGLLKVVKLDLREGFTSGKRELRKEVKWFWELNASFDFVKEMIV